MLRIVPTSDEELQKVQELQDLEELQVPGATAGVAFGETPPPPPQLMSLALHPPNHAVE